MGMAVKKVVISMQCNFFFFGAPSRLGATLDLRALVRWYAESEDTDFAVN